MRQQYHIRKVSGDDHIWDVNKLLKTTTDFIPEKILLGQIKEFNEPYWSHSKSFLTCKEIANHSKLIFECDLNYPILLCPDLKLIDGMHRVCKAYIEGHKDIKAIVLKKLPEPDYINVDLSELPY